MKLTELNPRWLFHGGEGVTMHGEPVPLRERVGITFDCPCGCKNPLSLIFANPVDGGLPVQASPNWTRSGDEFETMSLMPSILRTLGCPNSWHGFVTAGNIVHC